MFFFATVANSFFKRKTKGNDIAAFLETENAFLSLFRPMRHFASERNRLRRNGTSAAATLFIAAAQEKRTAFRRRERAFSKKNAGSAFETLPAD
jgi:hypothetical protein